MAAVIFDRGRGPEIVGTRITVYNILDYTQAGWHHTAIAATLRISSAEVLAAIEYIDAHRDEVMPRYQRMLERAARGNPPEVAARLQASHGKARAEVERRRQLKNQQGTYAGHHG